MISRLVWENVTNRPVRTLLSALMIAVPVTLILTLVGLSNGFIEDSRKRQSGLGADIMVKPQGANMVSFSTATMPVSLVQKLATEPHVAQAMGEVIAPLVGFDALFGIDPAAFDRMSGGFRFISGRTFRDPDDILLDSWYADQTHKHVGSTLNLLSHDWKVAGIVEPGILGHIFVPMRRLQEVQGGDGKVSQIYLKLDDPKNTAEMVTYLTNKYEKFPVISMGELKSLISVDRIPLLKAFIVVIEGIGVVIAFLVVSLSMYMAVLQRTREIGILKSLGATKRFIMGLILAEAFCLGLGGTIFGILFTFGTRAAIHSVMPASLPQAIVYTWWPIAGAIAMGAALLGALYPGMMAVRQDPIEALSYE
jgi:putative ABC transport system permease protein